MCLGLVRSCDAVFLLFVGWLWTDFNFFQLQPIPPSDLQVIAILLTIQVGYSFISLCLQWCRDSTIVSLADTFTSILAGVTIFSILGNLAYETNQPIENVVQGGTGLAFISYPEAISKFDAVPQV